VTISEDDLKSAYIAWVNTQCNREYTDEDLPVDIEYILLPHLIKTDGKDMSVTAQSAGGLSISRSSTDLPSNMLRIIRAHRKPRFA
jgi:hypothetical protein